MPTRRNPGSPEFYVYRLEADGVPFYVGVGRAGRAPMRIQYIRNCMRRQKEGLPVKWARHCEVAAILMRAGHNVCYRLTAEGLVYEKAAERERTEIDKLRRRFVLANIIHNPDRLESATAVAKAIKASLRRTT
jgi:hypothetical protein